VRMLSGVSELQIVWE